MAHATRRALAGLIGCIAVLAAPAVAKACGGTGYSYAGVSSRDTVSGVGATLTLLASPAVQNGHVAGWVGVGGPGLGPHGASEWIQVGYSGFPGISVGSLYYEIALPGRNPQYHEVLSNVQTGATHRIAVLEIHRRPGWWRVWVDGRRASAAYHLPGSAGRWHGVATAENWGGGMHACNEFAYRFRRVVVTHAPGGAWRQLSAAYRMHQGDNRLVGASPNNFVVRTPGALVALTRHRPSAGSRTATTSAKQTPSTAAPAPAAPPAQDPSTATPLDAAPPPDGGDADAPRGPRPGQTP